MVVLIFQLTPRVLFFFFWTCSAFVGWLPTFAPKLTIASSFNTMFCSASGYIFGIISLAISLFAISDAAAAEQPGMHVVFSTDCSRYHDWESLLLFHSAKAVKQQGTVTRIASGCSDEKKVEITAIYKKLFPQFGVHFTPDFALKGC